MTRSDDCANALKGAMTGSKKVRRGPRAEVVDLTGDSDDESGTLSPPRKNVIDLEDEDEDADEDLKRAIALSMQDMNDAQSQIKDSSRDSNGKANEQSDNATDSSLKQKAEEPENQTPPPPAACFGIPGLDRKQLEAERLARVAKRKAENSISPPPLSRASKLTKSTASSGQAGENESSKAVSAQNIPKHASKSRSSSPSSRPAVGPSATPSPQFLEGTVKKTWAFGCARKGDDIKIEEVLQTADVELAVLSAFQWDTSWLFSKFHNSSARFLLVMQAKEESTKMQYQEEVAHMSKIRLCFPPMDGQVNCMHSKLMLLFHPTYLRIAVPSANLVPYDWGEQGGVMENTVFIIDLPKISTKDIAESPKTAFFEELAFFLKASTIHDNIIAKLSNFDFTQTSGYRFVHTIGGSHTAENWNRTGHCALGRAVSSLGLRKNQPVSVDFVTSSIGSLTEEFIRAIYLSAQGDDGSIDFALRNPKSTATSSNETLKLHQARASDWKSRFKVYYPSEETVAQSKGGRRCAGTICFQEKWFQGPKFPKGILHDCISRRDGLLMHNKMMFVRPEKPIVLENGKVCRGWAYVGSANLSESAWGKLVYDRSSGRPKLNCRNWECGVLVPMIEASTSVDAATPKEESSLAKRDDEIKTTEADIAQVYGRTIPVPMKVPTPLLGSDLRPWYGAW